MTITGILKNAKDDHIPYLKSKSKSLSASVSFKSTTIRGYDRIIGDNPSCSGGCPISIGWNYSDEVTFALDEFESFRPRIRRHKMQMQIPPSARTRILQDWDYSLSSIIRAAREVQKEKKLREQTTLALLRREMFLNTLRGIFLWPTNLCGSKKRNQIIHYDPRPSIPPKQISRNVGCDLETRSSDSSSNLSMSAHDDDDDLSFTKKGESSNDTSNNTLFAIDDDIDDDDYYPTDGLSTTHHRHIFLE
jgi:hypothetical protein